MYESLASIDFNENFRELINRDRKERIKRTSNFSFVFFSMKRNSIIQRFCFMIRLKSKLDRYILSFSRNFSSSWFDKRPVRLFYGRNTLNTLVKTR